MTKIRAGSFVSNAKNQSLHGICLSIKRHGHVKSEVIKNNLKRIFPSTKNVSKNNVFQTRIKNMRSLPVLLNTNSFKEFKEKVGKSNIATFDVDAETFCDETHGVTSDIWLDLLNNNQDNNEDLTLSFKEHLSLLSIAKKEFSYRLPRDNDSERTGAVLLTGSIIDNFEQFWCCLCLDTCKRKTNALL